MFHFKIQSDSDIPYHMRVDTALQWLNGSSDGRIPDFISLYFSNTDSAGHEGGPDSLLVIYFLLAF